MLHRFLPSLSSAVVLSFVALTACEIPSDAQFAARGTPESLLDVSTEVVNLPVAEPAQRTQMSDWIQQDQPSRAELYCAEGDPACVDAQKILALHGVETAFYPSAEKSVALVYERILARDCHSRFVDNHSNLYNTNHASFGCSIAANMVQHVSDKQEFVAPAIMDPAPAAGSMAAYGQAYAPPTAPSNPASVTESVLESLSTD